MAVTRLLLNHGIYYAQANEKRRTITRDALLARPGDIGLFTPRLFIGTISTQQAARVALQLFGRRPTERLDQTVARSLDSQSIESP